MKYEFDFYFLYRTVLVLQKRYQYGEFFLAILAFQMAI